MHINRKHKARQEQRRRTARHGIPHPTGVNRHNRRRQAALNRAAQAEELREGRRKLMLPLNRAKRELAKKRRAEARVRLAEKKRQEQNV